MRNPSGHVTFRCDAELHAAFLAACQRQDVTASQVLRKAMRDFCDKYPQASLDLSAPKARKKGSKDV